MFLFPLCVGVLVFLQLPNGRDNPLSLESPNLNSELIDLLLIW